MKEQKYTLPQVNLWFQTKLLNQIFKQISRLVKLVNNCYYNLTSVCNNTTNDALYTILWLI